MALSPVDNNIAAADAAEVYFSTEDRFNELTQSKIDIESSIDPKSYTGEVSINELRADAELREQSYNQVIAELTAIGNQRAEALPILLQFFRVDNTSATMIKNNGETKKLTLDMSDNVVISDYP